MQTTQIFSEDESPTLKFHACRNHQVYILMLISEEQRKYILQ